MQFQGNTWIEGGTEGPYFIETFELLPESIKSVELINVNKIFHDPSVNIFLSTHQIWWSYFFILGVVRRVKGVKTAFQISAECCVAALTCWTFWEAFWTGTFVHKKPWGTHLVKKLWCVSILKLEIWLESYSLNICWLSPKNTQWKNSFFVVVQHWYKAAFFQN